MWKHPSRVALAKLKSMFLKRASRVSCSSCPARIHLLSLDVLREYEPNPKINTNLF